MIFGLLGERKTVRRADRISKRSSQRVPILHAMLRICVVYSDITRVAPFLELLKPEKLALITILEVIDFPFLEPPQ